MSKTVDLSTLKPEERRSILKLAGAPVLRCVELLYERGIISDASNTREVTSAFITHTNYSSLTGVGAALSLYRKGYRVGNPAAYGPLQRRPLEGIEERFTTNTAPAIVAEVVKQLPVVNINDIGDSSDLETVGILVPYEQLQAVKKITEAAKDLGPGYGMQIIELAVSSLG